MACGVFRLSSQRTHVYSSSYNPEYAWAGAKSRMYRRRLFLGLLIFFGLTASPAAADEAGTVWAKAGADGAVMTREMAACTREASTIWTSANTPGATSMANLIATVLVSGTVTPKVQVEYIRSCMVGRGFSAVTLSATETVDQNRQKTPEATAGWADRIFSRMI